MRLTTICTGPKWIVSTNDKFELLQMVLQVLFETFLIRVFRNSSKTVTLTIRNGSKQIIYTSDGLDVDIFWL